MPVFYLVKPINIVLIACVFFMACGGKKEPPKQAPQITAVDVIIAEAQTLNNVIEASGTVIANDFVQLRPEVAGRIVTLNVPEGKRIVKGTVIATLNSQDLVAQKAKSKVLLDLAVKTLERLKKLLDINGINQADYDAAENQVNSNKADIAYYDALIEKTIIKAPFTGIMGLRLVSVGAYISTNDVIASLQQENNLKIDFTLPEGYGDAVKRGASVNVIADTDTSHKKKAVIIAIEPQVNTTTRNLLVRAVLQGGKTNIGAFVKVEIDAANNKTTILVPTNAIIPNDKSNQLVIVKGGKASYVNVKTGIRQTTNVEITSGINIGDSVVVTGVLFTKQNGKVKVKSVKKLEDVGKQ